MVETRPLATYRLQLNSGCNLAQAARLLPYLNALGISTLYVSPLFKARRGSEHGYSVTNPLELNPELGSRNAFDHFQRKLKTWNLGLLLDIVPNHMALSNDNPWWQDVLEHGPSSPYADFFDIDWEPPCRLLQQKLLLPVLGRSYGECLEDQELSVRLDPEGLAVWYYQHRFPLDPATYLTVLGHRLEDLRQGLGDDHPDIIRLLGIITLIKHLPPRQTQNKKKRRERHHWAAIIKKSLWLLYENSSAVRTFIQENLHLFNGRRGEPASFTLLDRLLRQQVYRLACWLISQEMINYRRFFSINDLIGIRVEDPAVFAATHHLLFRLVEEGKIQGLRIDHIDGLYNPIEYLQRLQDHLQRLGPEEERRPFYIVTEKILGPDEELPAAWPVAGTTGYDFLAYLNNFFIHPTGLARLEALYQRSCGKTTWEEVVYEKKKLVLAHLFGGEVRNLCEELQRLASQDRQAVDLPCRALKAALIEVTANLEVYRTYVTDYQVEPPDRDRILRAVQRAQERQPTLNRGALAFLQRVLTLELPPDLGEEDRKEWLRFVCRWQQFTGPVMAKGLEDTAAYVYNPLLSLNEVGAWRTPVTPEAWHAFCRHRQERWPGTLNATSTHDTKRSEDVRARLNVLTELPDQWEKHLHQWRQWNSRYKVTGPGGQIPDANEEIFLYQTLLGAWPLQETEIPPFRERLAAYLIKALREAKVHSQWHAPQRDYEEAVLAFATAILQPVPDNPFLPDFLAFHRKIAFYGALNSLSQVLLKTMAPGVPDFYQGQEVWDFSLVDPDNRRPVAFDHLQDLLRELRQREPDWSWWPELWRHWRDGRLKLYLTYKALNCRRRWRHLLEKGDYLPVPVSGRRRRHVLAWSWCQDQQWLLVVATRWFASLTQPEEPPLGPRIWAGASLNLPPEAPRQWREELTGLVLTGLRHRGRLTLPLAGVFQELPLALLSGSTRPEGGPGGYPPL